MDSWVLEDFSVGDIACQIAEFEVGGHTYVMVFNRIDATRSREMINEKAEELGIEYRENSYEVKFDLKQNFNNDTYFSKPDEIMSVSDMRELGRIIRDLLEFHYKNSNAEAYLCVAEDRKLKRFYDRLAKIYTDELQFHVTNDLGEEGLGYEITTPSYQS